MFVARSLCMTVSVSLEFCALHLRVLIAAVYMLPEKTALWIAQKPEPLVQAHHSPFLDDLLAIYIRRLLDLLDITEVRADFLEYFL
jgi:hypothetical protein